MVTNNGLFVARVKMILYCQLKGFSCPSVVNKINLLIFQCRNIDA